MKKNKKDNKMSGAKKIQIFLSAGFVLLMGFLSFRFFSNRERQDQQISLDNDKVIMHAMGSIDGVDYTNSLEAFEIHYARGRRVFEVDFALTGDNNVVANHSGRIDSSQEEFLAKKIEGKYTPLSLEMVMELMNKHKDVIVVTDTKADCKEIVAKIVAFAQEADSEILDRVIPQVYSESIYQDVMNEYNFTKVIYTLYREKPEIDEVKMFVRNVDNLYAIALSKSRLSKRKIEAMNALGVQVFVHTLNAEREISKYLKKGASGIYTDEY